MLQPRRHPRLQGANMRRKSMRRNTMRGFSLMELLIVVAIILIIAMIAVPKFNQNLMAAREMGAINEIKSIHLAQTQYYSQFGRYANTLQELGPPQSGTVGPNGADLLPNALANGKHGGHIFTITPIQSGYAINVAPERFGNDGRRTFYSDQTTEVHEHWGPEPATATDPPPGGGQQQEAEAGQ